MVSKDTCIMILSIICNLPSCVMQLNQYLITGLEITAGQRTMSKLIWELAGQPFVLPVTLTGHI